MKHDRERGVASLRIALPVDVLADDAGSASGSGSSSGPGGSGSGSGSGVGGSSGGKLHFLPCYEAAIHACHSGPWQRPPGEP